MDVLKNETYFLYNGTAHYTDRRIVLRLEEILGDKSVLRSTDFPYIERQQNLYFVSAT